MNKYKVEFIKTYVVDVFAETETEAMVKAETKLNELMREGLEHYNETGGQEPTAYNVTNTDDPFNA